MSEIKIDLEKAIHLIGYKNRNLQKNLYESFLDKNEMKKYNHRFIEHTLLYDDLNSLTEDSSNLSILELIKNNQFEIGKINEFKQALNSGNRGEFLSDYTEDEYGKMKTYKVKGYKIGFAIKPDGDIVSVFNNTGIGGLASELLKAAIRFGGNKLDHFDGYLTGLYSKNGFVEVGRDPWNDDYAPSDWKYEPVNPFDPNTSVYANELSKYKNKEDLPEELKQVIIRYKEGKPDIIYRKLK